MKIVSVLGSPRSHGNTHKILSLIESSIKDRNASDDISIQRIHLCDKTIKMCKGCRACFDLGEDKCPLKDDVLDIKDSIQDADIIIFSSPIFVDDISGLMKNFIDRLAFICHRPSLFGKSAMVISTSGVMSSGHELKTMKSALSLWGANVFLKQSYKAGASITAQDAKVKYQKKLDKAAGMIASGKAFKKAQNPSFLSLMKFKIQQLYQKNFDIESIDHVFWSENGMLDDNVFYPSKIKSSSLKIAAARTLGSIIGKFVI